MKNLFVSLPLLFCTLAARPAAAQENRSLDLTINDVGISIGDSRRVTGLRINFRDRYLEEVNGINLTVWTPYAYTGVVRGLALGLPATGARRIEGIALAPVGIGTGEDMRGIAIGGIGMGVGSDLRGLAVGGIGVGVGENMRGISIGGIGAGVGGDIVGLSVAGVGAGVGGDARGILVSGIGSGIGGNLRGVSVAGLGTGVGGSAEGIFISGLGAGVGGDLLGLAVAGLGFGVGGNMRGITIAGIGFGVGGNANGLQIAGIGIGAGGTLRPVSIAGAGIGAPNIEGLAAALAIGTERARGLIIAPAYFRVMPGGSVNGVNVSAYNHVRGTQRGLAIGIFNYAHTLDGVQLGLLNYARNKRPGTRLIPIINIARASADDQ